MPKGRAETEAEEYLGRDLRHVLTTMEAKIRHVKFTCAVSIINKNYNTKRL
jgi:hypothetical protein